MKIHLLILLLSANCTGLFSQIDKYDYSVTAAAGLASRLYNNEYDYFISRNSYSFELQLSKFVGKRRNMALGINIDIRGSNLDSARILSAVLSGNHNKFAEYSSGFFTTTEFGPVYSILLQHKKWLGRISLSAGAILTIRDGMVLLFSGGYSVTSKGGYDWGAFINKDIGMMYMFSSDFGLGLNYDIMYGQAWLNMENQHGSASNYVITTTQKNYVIFTNALRIRFMANFRKRQS